MNIIATLDKEKLNKELADLTNKSNASNSMSNYKVSIVASLKNKQQKVTVIERLRKIFSKKENK